MGFDNNKNSYNNLESGISPGLERFLFHTAISRVVQALKFLHRRLAVKFILQDFNSIPSLKDAYFSQLLQNSCSGFQQCNQHMLHNQFFKSWSNVKASV